MGVLTVCGSRNSRISRYGKEFDTLKVYGYILMGAGLVGIAYWLLFLDPNILPGAGYGRAMVGGIVGAFYLIKGMINFIRGKAKSG